MWLHIQSLLQFPKFILIYLKIVHLDSSTFQRDRTNNPADHSVINLNITRDRDKMLINLLISIYVRDCPIYVSCSLTQ